MSNNAELIDAIEIILPDKKCKRCDYMAINNSDGWCYMFAAPPSSTCGQFIPTPPTGESSE